MNLETIKKWINELLKEKFNIGTELIIKLPPLDLLYLYVEIYKKFNVKLTVEDIESGCFSSVDLLSDYICNAL